MKVCTDACIFGACIANVISNSKSQILNCFDIGTGTGLLSLMISQKTKVVIEAIEIQEDAFNQAKYNFLKSPRSERLRAIHKDVKHFSAGRKYDFIISKPPFYQNDLISSSNNKNIAKHNIGLNIDELPGVIKKLLNKSGSFSILLPYHRVIYFEKLAHEYNFFLKEKLLIKHIPEHDYIRGVLIFHQTNQAAVVKELIIKNEDGKYTDDFIQLMSDYYMAL